MATVDVVVVAGGRPANFCDLGGGGSAAGVVAALEVDRPGRRQVRSILFNIFGGDHPLRRGVPRAASRTALEQTEIALRVPIVVRLRRDERRRRATPHPRRRGTTAEGLLVSSLTMLLDAARRAVELAA